ncbi:MAG: hypothetical protein M1820_002948 [Bogoriella megaspora]|nr:MAG: hypothetical protein M1820_002948 [Bogoriella megaspora]
MNDQRDDFVLLNRDDVSDFNEANILPESVETLDKIQEWLKPTAYHAEGSEYRKHLASHLLGTGLWIKSSEIYRRWHDGVGANSGTLWIKGIPGSGKSVVAANLVSELSTESVPVLFFFFRQIVAANHEPRSLLRDWLSQALGYSPPLQKMLKEYVDQRKSLESVSTDDLWRLLTAALAHIPRAYCVADALDEMDTGNEEFLQKLAEFGGWRPSAVKVLMTSRPVPWVEGALRKISTQRIRLEEKRVDEDIIRYVDHRLGSIEVDAITKGSIKAAVPGRANGLFLYARLAMDAFSDPDANISDVLKKLPLDLNVMYASLLWEHSTRAKIKQDLQVLILGKCKYFPIRKWISTGSSRSTAIQSGSKASIRPIRTTKNTVTKDLVRVACGPLLEILPDETARSSLEYLLSGCLDGWKVTGWSDSPFSNAKTNTQNQLKTEYPFLDYAASSWASHAVKALAAGAETTDLHTTLDRFLVSDSQAFRAWEDWSFSARKTTPLHATSRVGLIDWARKLLKQDTTSIDALDAEGRTPLHMAATEGHADGVALLLTHGANPDSDDSRGLKPLHHAATRNHAKVVSVLLEAGVDPLTRKTKENGPRLCGNAPSSIGQTPLMYACYNGHVEAVLSFLPHLKDIAAIHQALSWAAARGQSKVVAVILQQPGVDVDALVLGDTALFHACKTRDKATIHTLLQAGASPNTHCGSDPERSRKYFRFGDASSKRGFSPMHAFCMTEMRTHTTNILGSATEEEDIAILRLLVNSGGDPDQRDQRGQNCLHHAKGQLHITRALLESSNDPNAVDDNGNNLLHLNVNHKAIIDLLMKDGRTDINMRNKDECAPLLAALKSHTTTGAGNLLSYKPNLHLTDKEGNGPLHLAAKMQNENADLIKALIKAGANADLKNRAGEQPLHVAHGYEGSVRALIDAGAKLEARDHDGRIVLFRAISRRSFDVDWKTGVKQLLDSRADIRTVDYKGRSLLHEAVHSNLNSDQVQFLLAAGANPLAHDHQGRTLFHEATAISNRRVMGEASFSLEDIENLGLNTNVSDNNGLTPLHLTCTVPLASIPGPNGLTAFDFFLSKAKDANAIHVADHCGVQPIHLAASTSESYVSKLIEAGADPFPATFEGLTALHIACRASQSNIVGILLDAYKNSDIGGVSQIKSMIEAKDTSHQTALDYACKSGRLETVALLLNSCPNIDSRIVVTAFKACNGFRVPTVQHHQQDSTPQYAARYVNAIPRPTIYRLQESSPQLPVSHDLQEHDTTRLGEIIQMLISTRVDPCSPSKHCHSALGMAIEASVVGRCDHNFATFYNFKRQIESAQGSENKQSWPMRQAYMRSRQDALRQNVEIPFYPKGNWEEQQFFREMLARREFQPVLEMQRHGVDFLNPDWQGLTYMHILAKFGYYDILAKVCTHEAVAKLHDKTWVEDLEKEHPNVRGRIKPLLLVACERELPNMEVLKILIDLQVDLNAQHVKQVYGRKVNFMPSEAPLHTLAGGCHWWHVAQALPYLIANGANLDIRNEDGETPLHIALDTSCYRTGCFHKAAARILIESGADVNAVDDKGRDCLAKVGPNIDLLKLLIANGAKGTDRAVVSAIDNFNADMLEVLISSGADPNSCPDVSNLPMSRIQGFIGNTDHEYMPPLLYTARVRNMKSENLDRASPLVSLLLRFGADPYLDYHQEVFPGKLVEDEDSGSEPTQTWDARAKVKYKVDYEKRSVLHEVLRAGPAQAVIQPFLDAPSFDLERKDPNGQTLLLAACAGVPDARMDDKSEKPRQNLFAMPAGAEKDGDAIAGSKESQSPTLAEKLLSLGANLFARDNHQRNVLHATLERDRSGTLTNPNTVKLILSKAPKLCLQTDRKNQTPLHLALRSLHAGIIHSLLDAGSDALLPDRAGNTGLHFMAKKLTNDNAAKPLFARFLSLGVDINARNNRGETPLFPFATAGLGGDFNSIYGPSETEWEEFLAFLLEEGADLYARNGSGENLLHILAQHRAALRMKWDRTDVTVVDRFKHLLAMGLDPMIEDSKQRSAIDVASAYGNDGIVKLFERKS